ncbi:hypothetical protein [Polaribacter sp.]|uniref:hypothetical protein n=1 Tax=Polaribacter sp. TaxID=1920175 RepID=UPI00404847D5
MKKYFITLFVITSQFLFCQNYLDIISNSSNSNLNISHNGSFTLGTFYNNVNEPWGTGEGRFLEIFKNTGNVSMRIGNNFGRLSFAIAGSNGAFFPDAQTGNIIIRKQTTNKVFFSLNNTTNDGNHKFIFGDDTNTKTLTISNNGRVGIGTLTPDTELAVNGTIHAKKVKVDLNGWSDFVFKNNYNLPTLVEVENFIKKYGHLKDIPTENEVVKNGIDIGEMNAKLLQKIEELMLYTIQQQKQIEILKKEIIELKNKK